jgi:DNA-binding NarL/FixJ family response regulator
VLVVDDHDLVRAGLAELLNYEEDIRVVGLASNGLDALEKVKSLSPDVVLMDLRMPVMDGFEATTRISRERPGVRVLAVTHLEDVEYIKRIMGLGASGVVLKSSAVDELKQSIRVVHEGKQFLSPLVSRALSPEPPSTPQVSPDEVTLTPRECEVLRLIASGNSNQGVADALRISVRTVEFHRANLNEKLGAHDTASLIKCAIQKGLITIEV